VIVIVDYRMGNLGSIANMLRKIGSTAIISSDPKEIAKATKIILPGVGAFDNGIKSLADLGLLAVLNAKALVEKVPVLGICLGMQLMTRSSEEGREAGLGWVDAATVRFATSCSPTLKIPHMGWNTTTVHTQSALFEGLDEGARFYFVHSYHSVCNDESNCIAKTQYGYEFTSAFQRNNVFGVQFHPEKSHKYGMRLLSNFVNLM
jgi:glutamine amidotransferase